MSHLVTLTMHEMQAEQDYTLAEARKTKAYQTGMSKADETIRALAKRLGEMQTTCDREKAARSEEQKLYAKHELALQNQMEALQRQMAMMQEENNRLSRDRERLISSLKTIGNGYFNPPHEIIYGDMSDWNGEDRDPPINRYIYSHTDAGMAKHSMVADHVVTKLRQEGYEI